MLLHLCSPKVVDDWLGGDAASACRRDCICSFARLYGYCCCRDRNSAPRPAASARSFFHNFSASPISNNSAKSEVDATLEAIRVLNPRCLGRQVQIPSTNCKAFVQQKCRRKGVLPISLHGASKLLVVCWNTSAPQCTSLSSPAASPVAAEFAGAAAQHLGCRRSLCAGASQLRALAVLSLAAVYAAVGVATPWFSPHFKDAG